MPTIVAIDLGGTLVKVSIKNKNTEEEQSEFHSFSITSIEDLKAQLQQLNVLQADLVGFSGGGSVRYAEELQLLFPNAKFFDEKDCLVQGLLSESNSGYCSNAVILANIGTGASFIKIDRKTGEFKRIGGTNLGGGVIRGLCQWRGVEFPCSSSSATGSHTAVDTLVRDIYGSDYESAKLIGDCVAGSLGKLSRESSTADAIDGFLYMIASNMAHLLSLYASLNDVKEIILSGSLSTIEGFKRAFEESMNYYNADSNLTFHFHHNSAYLGCLGIIHRLSDY